MSTMQCVRRDRLPEVVAWEAEDGRMMCKDEWFAILIARACEKEGFRTAADWAISFRAGYCSRSASSVSSSPLGVSEREVVVDEVGG